MSVTNSSNNLLDAKCLECEKNFTTQLPEWSTGICEGCITSMTSQAQSDAPVHQEQGVCDDRSLDISLDSAHDRSLDISLDSAPSSLEENTSIYSDPGTSTIQAQQLSDDSPAMLCCCGYRIETADSHQFFLSQENG